MAVKYLNTLGPDNHLNEIKSIVKSFNLTFKTLKKEAVIIGLLYNYEFELEGDSQEIENFLNKLQSAM